MQCKQLLKQFTVTDSYSSKPSTDFRSTGLCRRYFNVLFQVGANTVVLTLGIAQQGYFTLHAEDLAFCVM